MEKTGQERLYFDIRKICRTLFINSWRVSLPGRMELAFGAVWENYTFFVLIALFVAGGLHALLIS